MFRFTPRTIPNQVLVVGCGGTGSRLVPLLAQFLASISKDKNPRGWLDAPTILLADFDEVEQKNLQRQNFVAADVGKHKAAVLAQRYSRAYGVNIIPVLKRIDGTGHCLRELSVPVQLNQSIVIMCVDTAQARRDIIATVNASSNPNAPGQGAFFIDAGNEDNFGQVRFFSQAYGFNSSVITSDRLPKISPVVEDIPAIPIDLKYYDELVDMPGQGSCADLDQTLAINALMATLIMGVVQNYYYVKPMTYNQISISLDGAVSTSYNTASELLRRASAFDTRGQSGISRVQYSRFRPLDLAPMFDKYIKESNKILKALTTTTVAQTAVEAEPAPKKRPRKKSDTTAEVTAEALPPDTRRDAPADPVLDMPF